MKNWLFALSGTCVRALEHTPRVCAWSLKLGLEVGLVRTAHAGAGGIAALRHEAGDHAVEHHAVVETFLRQLGNPLDMAGRQIGAQLDDHIAALPVSGIERERERLIGHMGLLLLLLKAI